MKKLTFSNNPRLRAYEQAQADPAPATGTTMTLRIVAWTAAGRIGYSVTAPVVGPINASIDRWLAVHDAPGIRYESITVEGIK